MCTCVCVYMYMCMCAYMKREREREREIWIHGFSGVYLPKYSGMYLCTPVCVYVYIFSENIFSCKYFQFQSKDRIYYTWPPLNPSLWRFWTEVRLFSQGTIYLVRRDPRMTLVSPLQRHFPGALANRSCVLPCFNKLIIGNPYGPGVSQFPLLIWLDAVTTPVDEKRVKNSLKCIRVY